MSITDELRKYADRLSDEAARKSEHGFSPVAMALEAIADRIDVEHEAACAEAYGNGVMSVPIALDESQWVKLPVDADGVPIRVGDVMDSKVDYLFDGKPFTVRALVLCEDGWEVGDGRFGNRYEPDSLHHHHQPPTVEDVLQEFANRVCNSGHQWGLDAADTIAEFAAKLRLAKEGE